jgi:ectoine hydroxylase-related dioxygenase (phytanoyl-CoA dioxygenase family)
MRRGSALLYLGSTYHGGGANSSAAPRLGLVNTYALGWLRQEENHYLAIPREVADGFPDRVRELMGYATHAGSLGSAGLYDPVLGPSSGSSPGDANSLGLVRCTGGVAGLGSRL